MRCSSVVALASVEGIASGAPARVPMTHTKYSVSALRNSMMTPVPETVAWAGLGKAKATSVSHWTT